MGDKTVTVHFSPRLSPAAKESLKEKLKALAEDNHFKEIVRSIDWTRARVEALPNTSFESYQSGKTKSRGTYSADGSFKYSVEIWLNPDGDYYGYLEEFFHAEQFLSAKQPRCIGDIEFEAKAFLARIFNDMCEDSLSLIIRDNLNYYNSILDYINNPKDENKRKDALSSFVRMGYMNYKMDNDKTLDEKLIEYYKYFPKDK